MANSTILSGAKEKYKGKTKGQKCGAKDPEIAEMELMIRRLRWLTTKKMK